MFVLENRHQYLKTEYVERRLEQTTQFCALVKVLSVKGTWYVLEYCHHNT
jgi:hypothetical protein